ncbi:MAG: S-adenosylmethionine synthetase N-terminal domain-containing protein, partial [Methanocorpusculum sp.]|nr:S-adenosylmethionine synthetase N-terminal domain-containing protein [Methanocorpusculum sp.]
MSKSIISSEAMGCGHPDKVADFISDSVLDACLAADPNSRVGCEVLVKGNQVVLAGEISTLATPDYEGIVRSAIRALGYR